MSKNYTSVYFSREAVQRNYQSIGSGSVNCYFFPQVSFLLCFRNKRQVSQN